jgi:DNA-binding SARP family transcriptional activator/tetratricopeptide (TPR) repeat protein
MEFRVLGPTELWSAGQPCGLGPARERSALAILLLTPRTIVPVDALIDRLWNARPPPKARDSLSVYVTRLRASLRQAVGDSVRLVGRANGYLVDVAPEAVDLHRFRRLRRQAGALAASGDYQQAAVLLREADGLWHGEALAGIRGDWVARMRDSLEEERRAAILERVECDLELGRHAELVGELGGLLAQYPLDEAIIACQMTALYRSGRSGDALSMYRETRGLLAEEQGTEPGQELSELHQRILRQDPKLVARFVGPRPGPVPPLDTLPPETVGFVGRRQELTQLTAEHGSTPSVCVIEGMPGVGKTALAARVARMVADRYPDGVFYLSFHTHDPGCPALDSAEALDRLLRMVDLPPRQIPDSPGARAVLWRSELARRRTVLILDDAAGRDQVRPLLPRAGECLVLVTARRRIPDLEGARTLTLDELPLDDAVTMFTQIAGPGRARDRDGVATAVELCGRLPLAIQLSAGRLAQGHPPGLADLVEELSLPPAGLGRLGPASPELTSAFDLSYRALEPDHQQLFLRLGVSPCLQVSLHAAAVLGGCTVAEAEKALTVLVDHHLLVHAPADQFRFHGLIRGYAAARATRDDPAPERHKAIGRLLDYYLFTADQADRLLHPLRHRMVVSVTNPPAEGPTLRTPDDAAAWLESEWRSILQAARHADRHDWKRHCADLTHVLAGFVEIRAYWDEAIAAQTLALHAARDLADPARIAHASLELSVVSRQTGRQEAALALAEEAATIYRSLADGRGQAEALDQIGVANLRAARSREALAYFGEARTLYGDAADQHGVADTLSHSAIACWNLGRYADGMEHLREALSLYRGVADRRGEAKTLNNLGKMQIHCGSPDEALESYQASLEIFTEIGGTQNHAILHQNIGNVLRYKGSYEEALVSGRKALAIFRQIGDLPNEANVLNQIGAVYQGERCDDEALVHYEKARSIAEQIGNLSEHVIALRGIADVYRGSGRYGEALDHYRTALSFAREVGDLYEEAKILVGIAETTLGTQGPHAARIVFRQALDIFEQLGVPEAESARIRLETTDPAFGRRSS